MRHRSLRRSTLPVPLPWGDNCYKCVQASAGTSIASLTAANVGAVRIFCSTAELSGPFTSQASFCASLVAAGIRPLPYFETSNKLDQAGDDAVWQGWMSTWVTALAPWCEWFECGNEMDLGGGINGPASKCGNPRARELARLAAPIIRNAGRKCILMPAAGSTDLWLGHADTQAIFAEGVVDGVAIHTYPGYGVSPWTLPPDGGPASLKVVNFARDAPVPASLPIFITERGIGTDAPPNGDYTGSAHQNVGTLQQQSDWVRDSYNAMFTARTVAGKAPIRLISWYTRNDRAAPRNSWDDVCGFYYSNGAEKTGPATSALGRFTAQPASMPN